MRIPNYEEAAYDREGRGERFCSQGLGCSAAALWQAGSRRAGRRFIDKRFHLGEAGPELLHGDVDHAPDGDVDAPLWDPINEKRDCPPSRFQYSRADPRSAGPLSDGGYASDDPIPE